MIITLISATQPTLHSASLNASSSRHLTDIRLIRSVQSELWDNQGFQLKHGQVKRSSYEQCGVAKYILHHLILSIFTHQNDTSIMYEYQLTSSQKSLGALVTIDVSSIVVAGKSSSSKSGIGSRQN